MLKNTIQDKITLLSKLDNKADQYNKLYEEIMTDIISSKEMYSIVKKSDSTNANVDIFCGVNTFNDRCIWLFTEKSFAEDFIKYYHVKSDENYIVDKVKIEDITVFSFNAMFSGLSKLIVDQGKNTLITDIYDFVNISLISIGRMPILEKKEYEIMNIFNKVKYEKEKIWVTPSKEITGEEFLYSEFILANSDNGTKVYKSEEECKKDSIKHGFTKGFAIAMDLKSLRKVLENTYKEKVENVIFIIDNLNIRMDIKRVLAILQRMA